MTTWSCALVRALFVVAAGLVVATHVSAQQPAGWVPASAAPSYRVNHTATRLLDGRVLVVGGYQNGWNSQTDLYHPDTGDWGTGRFLNEPRSGHVAVRLGDGRVLVAGGTGYIGSVASAEAWSPEDGLWRLVGAMSVGRTEFAGAVLHDGRVLVTGGQTNAAPKFLDTSEIFDPATNTWSPAAPMRHTRFYHTLSVLADGRVLAIGGFGEAGPNGYPVLTSCELFDPVSKTWSDAASSLLPHGLHVAVTLANGRVLVAGGEGASGTTTAAEVYDPATDTWTATGPLPAPKGYSSAVLLASGHVLVGGGDAPFNDPTSVEYDPETNAWGDVRSMERHRVFCTVTLLDDGRVLCVGGRDGSNGQTSGGGFDTPGTTELYGSVAPIPPAISSVEVGRDDAGKQQLVVRGTGFGTSAAVFVDGVAFKKSAVVMHGTSADELVQRGKLQSGRSINRAIRPGRTVTITVATGDGSSASVGYTR
jgi:hypothetical protein